MGDHHVAVGARVLVEAGAVVDGERLRHVDLDVVDVVPVPTGSNMPLAKRSAIRFWTASRPRKWSMRKTRSSGKTPWTSVLSARALSRSTPNGFSSTTRERSARPGLAERRDELAERAGRDGQVVQPARLVAEVLLAALDRLAQRRGLVGAEGGEREPAREPLPRLLVRAVADGVAGDRPEVVVRPAAPGGADDPVALRHQPRALEVEEPGQELAPGEVARRAVEDDRVVLGNRGAVCAGHRREPTPGAAAISIRTRARRTIGRDAAAPPARP